MTEQTNFVLYQTPHARASIQVLVHADTLWASQRALAQLFDVTIPTINRHLKNIFDCGELDQAAVTHTFALTSTEGHRTVTRETTYYNLDAIISVGYRVNSVQATHFRQWATTTLKDFMIKGFVLDDERLKQGSTLLGQDYFDELLERVRSIRASERRIWQKLTDIFAEISADYDKNSPVTQQFYATVQNKFHYAITGQTAAEIIYHRADRDQPHMGLTTWQNAPDGRVLKRDAMVAKNYLSATQIKALERNVTGYFDYIEDLIARRTQFTMREFAASIDRFLSFREYAILPDNGSVSMQAAQAKAASEYAAFNQHQRIRSDFDRAISQMIEANDND
ncbi:virulence RhuM family protein [Lacticaseibacillus kribbianus]|uniref:virulence RhuM family protein n=1 Tax=Lacticaseibacillus kribbianus TaxID=2926292 RepID=UPI001CD6F2F0|nr:virulence RhuM family protein [Lacticaseibacillus kribbianus]